ncbi:MAG: DNA polymerase III subunit gamma/tau, partial [Eubacteriales bacterium]
MHQTLYRKWRPATFDDVCGQEHVTSILRYQVESGKTSHAYLFCGSRGTGKTTCAKLLARALNCEHPVHGSPCGVCDTCKGILSGAITDVIEMDAASNNGVDNIRDIRDDVAYAPTECKKRVFIIDEVHMLSTSAFNALLKTLEEPPEHIVFILATTEMHKIPATILSRCQRYDFRRIESSVIVSRLRTIAQSEGIAIEDDALHLIAKLSAGGMRDAIGMLELCAGAGNQTENGAPIDSAAAAALLGTSPVEETAAVVRAIAEHDIDAVFRAVDHIYKEARDIGVFWQSLISFYRDILVCKTVADPTPLLDLTEKQRLLPMESAKKFTLETLLYHTHILDEVMTALQRNSAPARITVEMALVRLCDNTLEEANDALLARISSLEEKLAAGFYTPAVPADKGQKPEAAGSLTASPLSDAPEVPFADGDPESADNPPRTEPDIVTAADHTQTEAAGDTAAPQPKEPPARKTRTGSGKTGGPDDSVPEEKRSTGAKKTLRAFAGWQQVMSRLEKHNPGAASFL